jgi:hypothetical protein
VRPVDDRVVPFACQLGTLVPLSLQVVQVLEEQQPRRLLGVVELSRHPCVLPKDVVDILERLLEHMPPNAYRID